MAQLGWRDWIGGQLPAPAIVLLLALAGMSLLAEPVEAEGG
ncbi:hypothetical protein [Dokdonella sp.]